MGVIYAIMNDKNDKKYFGFTSVSGEMAKCALNNKIKILNYKNATKEQLLGVSNKIIRREIMNYNHDIKWSYEIVEENVPKENLNERKRAWICEFNTDDSRFGYNICLNDRLVERNHKEHNVIQTYKTIPKIIGIIQIKLVMIKIFQSIFVIIIFLLLIIIIYKLINPYQYIFKNRCIKFVVNIVFIFFFSNQIYSFQIRQMIGYRRIGYIKFLCYISSCHFTFFQHL